MAVQEITVEQLAERLAVAASGASSELFRLIDVREPSEYAEARVPGAVSMPLATVPTLLDQLGSGDGEIVMICHAGGRSLQACEFLDQNGVAATNVIGGTQAWKLAGYDTISGVTDSSNMADDSNDVDADDPSDVV